MSTTILCPHGHAITPGDPLPATVACPRCGAVFATGGAVDPFALPAGSAARPAPRKDRDDEDADDDDRPGKRKPRDDDEDDEDRPRKRKPRAIADKDDDRPRKRKSRDEEEEDEEDDEPVNVQKLTRKQKQLSLVRLGILFHAIKLWTYLVALVFGLIAMPVVLFTLLVGGSLLTRILVHVTFNLAMTLAPILGTIGSILCAFAPARSEARGTIIVSLAFDLLAPLFGLFQLLMITGWVITDDDRVGRLVMYMFYARMTCTIVAWWLFQIYLRKLSFYMRESLLASECLNVIVHLLIATIISPTLVIATFLVVVFISSFFGLILFFATLGWFLYFLVTFPIRQFRLLYHIRNRIYTKFLKPPDDD